MISNNNIVVLQQLSSPSSLQALSVTPDDEKVVKKYGKRHNFFLYTLTVIYEFSLIFLVIEQWKHW